MVADARVIVIEGRRPRIAAFIVPIGDRSVSKLAEAGKLAFNRTLRDTLSRSIEPVGIPRIWRYLDSVANERAGQDDVWRSDCIARRRDFASEAFLSSVYWKKTSSVPCSS